MNEKTQGYLYAAAIVVGAIGVYFTVKTVRDAINNAVGGAIDAFTPSFMRPKTTAEYTAEATEKYIPANLQNKATDALTTYYLIQKEQDPTFPLPDTSNQ